MDYHNPAGMPLTLLRVPPQLDNTEKIKALTQSFAIYDSLFFLQIQQLSKIQKTPKRLRPKEQKPDPISPEGPRRD